MSAPGLILWDFDGTLAHRPGLWGGCLLETLDAHEPGHGIAVEELRSHLRDGFPWHTPAVAHTELSCPDAWWRPIEVVMARAYERAGVGRGRSVELAALARALYVDPSVGWELFDDTAATLGELSAAGWRHAILSNHVPELPALVDALGLGGRFERVLSSAVTGYEKPNPAAFELALERCGRPERVWMVGDNPIADVEGAEAVGIDAILVRRPDSGTRRHSEDLRGVVPIINGRR